MPDLAHLAITKRQIGFNVNKSSYHAYKQSIDELHRGIKEIAKHAEKLWNIRDEVPTNAHETVELSDDAAKLADRLGDALKTIAGLRSSDDAMKRDSVKELISLARTFCEHAQSKLERAERLSFE